MTKKYFNVALSYDMIAQAYQNNESYNSMCFLIGPPSNNLPTGFTIYEAHLSDNGHLIIEYENKTPYSVTFYIENDNLYCKFMEGGSVMSIVDLGNVVGPQGATGATGPQGPAGANGSDGITPTFFIGDGTGGTTEGHLYADYDNPYTPTP